MSEFVTRISINEELTNKNIALLNNELANTIVAQQIIKFAHWNVKGPGFYPAHLLFDKVFKVVLKATDRIGERITTLGGIAEGLPDHVAKNAYLDTDFTPADVTVRSYIESIANVVSELSNDIRKLAGQTNLNRTENTALQTCKDDLVTQNMLLDLAEKLDVQLYFLEAHLQG